MITLVVRESTSVQNIERESEKDPELSSVRYYVRMGECKMPSYLCVKNELFDEFGSSCYAETEF